MVNSGGEFLGLGPVFGEVMFDGVGYGEFHQLGLGLWRQVEGRGIVHANPEGVNFLVFVLNLKMSHKNGIFFFANTTYIAADSGDHNLIEIKRRFNMFVLEMHFNTVQLGQTGVAYKTYMCGKHFANIGTPLSNGTGTGISGSRRRRWPASILLM